jgi:cysteinyl-tRNA synthetase
LTGVLGLHLDQSHAQQQDIAPFVELLIELRTELRKAKQYALADTVRSRLTDLGITLEDGPQGTRWKAK